MTNIIDRTIHLEIVNVDIPGPNGKPLTLTSYDCGGQENYATAQTPFLSISALYLLVVSAEEVHEADDESKKHNFLRFLEILQARAPGAVIQIILTKTDLLTNPEKKAAWVLDAVNKEMNKWRKHGRSGALLRIEPNVILTSVKNASVRVTARNALQDDSRDRLTQAIIHLTSASPPKLPTVGQVIPLSWEPFEIFVDTVREIGIDDKVELFNVFLQRLNPQQLDTAENSVVANNDKRGYTGLVSVKRLNMSALAFAIAGIISASVIANNYKRGGTGLVSVKRLNMSALPFAIAIAGIISAGYNGVDPASQTQNNETEKDRTSACAYCKVQTLLDIWEDFRKKMNHSDVGSRADDETDDDIDATIDDSGKVYCFEQRIRYQTLDSHSIFALSQKTKTKRMMILMPTLTTQVRFIVLTNEYDIRHLILTQSLPYNRRRR